MAIYELKSQEISEVSETSFADEGIKERGDLQRLLLDKIDIIADDLMVITEEFGDWVESKRRIDILAIDKHAKLVVIELKRTQDGGHMELQAIRYAAMISTLSFDQVVEVHNRYLTKREIDADAREEILAFLEWEEPNEEKFANDVRIILISAEFSKELTTSVMWLNSRGLDINCIRIKPYKLGEKILIDIQQLIPLPEAEEYQVKVREKDQRQRLKQQWQQKPLPVIWKELKRNCSKEEVKRAEEIQTWLESHVTEVFPTKNAFAPFLQTEKHNRFFFKVTVDGVIEIWFQHLANRPPFSDESLRRQLMEKLNAIPGLNIPDSKLKGRPQFPLKLLLKDQTFQLFKEAFEWAFSIIKSANATDPLT